MNIVFTNKKGDCSYTVTDINYGYYKGKTCTYVGGGYGSIARRMPTKLFKCKRTGRPVLTLSGKMYAVNIKDDKFFKAEIMDKADLK